MLSIRTKFSIGVGVFAVLFSAFIFLRTWHLIGRQTEELSLSQAELALTFDAAIRGYVADKLCPLMEDMLDKDEFISEAMSPSFVARTVFEQVRGKFPGYMIRIASVDPRNPVNTAGPEEFELIEYFRANASADRWSGSLLINGKNYLVDCVPRRMEQGCLRCHGLPQEAPASLIARYGPKGGFYHSPGDVAALDIVGIPLDPLRAAVAKESASQLIVMTLGIAVLFAAVLLLFYLVAGKRLAAISAHFKKAAEHEDGGPLVLADAGQQDEIGVLASNFNSLAAKLHALHASLEQKVDERTAKLRDEIAQRKQVQDELQLAQFCIDRASDAIFWIDPHGRIVYANEKASKVLGYSPEELRSMTVQDIDPLYQKEKWPSHWEELRRKKSFVIQSAHQVKDGHLIPTEITVNHIDFGGKEINCAFARDISERKRAQEQLLQAKEAAEAANRAKSEFLAHMSHEIRTPMTAIMGFVDILLEKTPFNPENIDAALTIRRNCEHLLGIISDILDITKIEAGSLIIERKPCSPGAIIAEVVRPMQIRAAAKGITLDVEYQGPIPATIRTDPMRLRQVIVNILGNAVKFTELGGVRLVAKLQNHNSRLQIQVIDTGIGMSANAIDDLFKPFTQADSSTKRRYGGAGLGLSISKHLLELLGGDISVESKIGTGSTFTITVPTGPLDGVELLDNPADVASQTQAAPVVKSADEICLPNRLKVLLAEDGPDNQRLVAFLLKKAGAEVTVVENGQKAVVAALASRKRGKPFDVILMDMQMPIMDGYDATKTLRAKKWTGPIIALTAHAMPEHRLKCLEAGCDEYLSKPIEKCNLLGALARFAGDGHRNTGEITSATA